MMPLLLLATVGVCWAGMVVLAAFYVQQRLTFERRLAQSRLRGPSARAFSEQAPSLISAPRLTRVPRFGWLPMSHASAQRLTRDLQRAGWRLSALEYMSLRLAAAVSGVTMGIILGRGLGIEGLATLVVLPIGFI